MQRRLEEWNIQMRERESKKSPLCSYIYSCLSSIITQLPVNYSMDICLMAKVKEI